ncbi:hypothetical protein HMPREF0063_11503 [Aeromicrobium marinum DSM 15272]|uniref:DUF11 domain-containing protein n=1 Tax=Aeromicrobium marinum DSM 15272 TaxID=585531 RepID=E2SBU4_9ACTN|nr:hypothetical protein [Aeromicrobium marinum]EFQ83230.1 hypothetical protein HMPREF0063_11503 [Aeromicrobium marinum DSM 15272]
MESAGLREPTVEVVTESLNCPVSVGGEDTETGLTMKVRFDEYSCWRDEIAPLQAGQTFEVVFAARNMSSEQIDDWTLRVELPDGVSLVPDSVLWGNARIPDGVRASNGAFTEAGGNFGSYSPGGSFYVMATLIVGEATALDCGEAQAMNLVGVVTTSTGESDRAWVRAYVRMPCPASGG